MSSWNAGCLDREEISNASSSERRSSKDIILCDCPVPAKAPRWTSWTDLNPGRRFNGCPYYKDPVRCCGFHKWVDEELTPHYKAVFNQLRQKLTIAEEKLIDQVSKADQLNKNGEMMKQKYARMKEKSRRLELKSKRLEVVIWVLLMVIAVLIGRLCVKVRFGTMLYLP